MTKYFPKFSDKPFDRLLKRLQDKSFHVRPEWRLEPAGKVPIVSDSLVPCLEEGSVVSVAGVRRVASESRVELQDGSSVEVDVIVWCTGYKSDFSIVEPKFDPTCRPQRWLDAPGSNGKALFRLYHNVFSVEKPDSLAFLGNVQITIANFQQFDMASMALTQVWANKSVLPTRAAMIAAVDKEHEWLADLARRCPNVSPGHCNMGKWVRAMDDLAGTGVNEYLGYGIKGLRYRLREPKFSQLLTAGIWSPHIHRVFEGKRKRWEGAKEAIIQVNERVRETRRTKGGAA
jgi:dimethylaniline monooxygenase (N-oxide forming)